MTKQKISETMLTTVSDAAGRMAYKDRNQVKEGNQAAIQTTAINWAFHLFIYRILQARYQVFQAWLAKLVNAYMDEQILLADEIIKENSRLYPYNFLGSPQSLFLLPNTHKQHMQTSLFNMNKSAITSLSSDINVVPLDKYRYELTVNGNTEEMRVNIYDEAKNMVLSENITRRGNFTRIYDLKWAKVAAVSFEVVSKNGMYQSGQL